MPFDPDAFLKETAPSQDGGFDPDAFLRETEPKGAVSQALKPITSYPETYTEVNRAARQQMAHGVEELTKPTGGDLWESAKAATKGVAGVAGGAIGYALSPITAGIRTGLSRPVEEMTGIPKEYTEFGAELAIPGIGLTRPPRLPMVTRRPAKGPEAEAGRYLESKARDPEAARRALEAPEEIVSGSKPTTFQQTGDLGLGQVERGATTRQPASFQERFGEQNAARLEAMENIQKAGSPEEVATHLRTALQRDTAQADEGVRLAQQRAWEASQQVGGTYDPTTYGNIFRRELQIAEDAARANERTLWQQVDPDGTLRVNPQPIQALERGVYGNMTEAGAVSITPAERQIADLIQGYRSIVPFQELRDLRSLTSTALREELYTRGQTPAYARLSRLRGGIEEAIPRTFTEEGAAAGDVAERLRAASAATRQRAETFRPVRDITRREGAEGPYRMGEASVPGRIVQSGARGYDAASSYLRAVGNERGLLDLQDAVAASARREVIGANGEINPRKLEGWLKRYQDTLRAIDERDGGGFSQRLRNLGTAQETLDTALARQTTVAKQQGRDELRNIVGAVDDADITRMVAGILGRHDAVGRMRELVSRLSGNDAALQGVRRAVVEHLRTRLLSNMEAAATGKPIIKAEQFQNFVKHNEPALRQVMAPEQVQTMLDIARDIQLRSNRTVQTGIRGRSTTAQDIEAMRQQEGAFKAASKQVGKVVGKSLLDTIAGFLPGIGPLAVRTGEAALSGQMAKWKARGINNIQELVDEAMLNPEVARELLSKTHTTTIRPGVRAPRQAGGGVPAIGGTGGRSPGETTPAGAREAREGPGEALPDGGTQEFEEGGEVRQQPAVPTPRERPDTAPRYNWGQGVEEGKLDPTRRTGMGTGMGETGREYGTSVEDPKTGKPVNKWMFSEEEVIPPEERPAMMTLGPWDYPGVWRGEGYESPDEHALWLMRARGRAQLLKELKKSKDRPAYASGGDVDDNSRIEDEDKLPLPGQSRGLRSTAGPTVTSTMPEEDIPAPKTNRAGETLPTYILKAWGQGLAGLPQRATEQAGELQRTGYSELDAPAEAATMATFGPWGTARGATLTAGMRGRGRRPPTSPLPPELHAGDVPAADRPVTRSHNMPPEELETVPPVPAARATSSLGLRDIPLDQAIEVAKSERHVIPSNPRVREGYVGAPNWVKTPEDLTQLRADFDRQVERGLTGAKWYQEAQGGIKEMAGPSPKRQHQASQELALTSAQATPETNLGFALQGHNALMAGKPLDIVRTGQIAETMKEGHKTGEIKLGRKTGIYSRHMDPTMEDPSTGTNDIWHARALGYENPEGGLAAAQHAFMDAETVLAVARANERRLGGRSDWTPGEIQAAPWVAGKAEGLQEQFGWSPERAMAEAVKTYPQHFEKHTAYGTHEATPGVGTRHLPGIAQGTQAEREAFAADPRSTWRDPSGRDVLYQGLGMWTRPSTKATGVFEGPRGMEINPAEVARPMVSFAGKPGERAVDPASQRLMNAAEAARAYIDAQNAGAWSIPIRGQKVGLSTSAFMPRPGGGPLPIGDIGRLQAIGGPRGLPGVIDYGEGSVLTSFGGGPTGKEVAKGLRSELGEDITRALPGTEAVPAKLDTGYIDYQKLWGRAEGTGGVTRALKQQLMRKDAPDLIARLDSSPEIRRAVLGRLQRDAELAAQTGQPIRADLQRARQIVAESGFSGLFAALKSGAALPAAAFAPLVQLLAQQEERPVE